MTRHRTDCDPVTDAREGPAAILIIGVGSSLAGEYEADYNTPGSDSKAAAGLTEERFEGYSGQEIYVVWKDESGADTPAARERRGK